MNPAAKRRRTKKATIRAAIPTTTGTNLPDDVIEHILTFIPIKLAIQTGSICKRLKRSWRLSRNFDFSKGFLKRKQKDQISNIINSILKNHEGDKVDRLHLNVTNYSIPMTVIHSWIKFAIRKSIKELDLEVPKSSQYFLNPKILHGARLESLRLSSCSFNAILTKFDHFFSLKKLVLDRIALRSDLLSNFLANCLFLETVEVSNCHEISMLEMIKPHLRLQRLCIIGCRGLFVRKISAPKLSIFKYRGYHLYFGFPFDQSLRMLLLEEVSITFTGEVTWSSFNSLTLLHFFAGVRVLSIDSKILEKIPVKVRGDELLWMSFFYVRLEVFNLNMVDITYVSLLDIAYFLERCPALVTFSIDLEGYFFESYSLYWEVHGEEKLAKFTAHFNKLKEIKVKGFKLHEMEILLVKFLLSKAPNLEMMTLMPPKKRSSEIKVADILSYYGMPFLSPASPKVQVTVREQSKDDVIS